MKAPIYRAKKIDSDERVEGYLIRARFYPSEEYEDAIQVVRGRDNSGYQIDPSTLAIHFEDMVDSEGTKIFASLSEDGMGGDIGDSPFDSSYKYRVAFDYQRGAYMTLLDKFLPTPLDKRIKITGIQQ